MSSGGVQFGHISTAYLAGRVAAFRTVANDVPIELMIPATRGEETTTETPASITIDPAILKILSIVISLPPIGCS
jgi:hypothetical protein